MGPNIKKLTNKDQALTDRSIKRLYEEATKGPRGSKLCNEVILSFLLTTGLKLPQIANLKVKHAIDITGQWNEQCKIIKDYAGVRKEGTCFIVSHLLKKSLDRYIEARRQQSHKCTFLSNEYRGLDPESYLLLNQNGDPFFPQSKIAKDGKPKRVHDHLQNKVTHWFKSANVTPLSTKNCRSTFAYKLKLAGVSDDEIFILLQNNKTEYEQKISPNQLNLIKSTIRDLFRFIDPDDDDKQEIYHYCTTQSFLSIVKSKSLWISDLLKMNDPNELIQNATIAKKTYNSIFDLKRFDFDISNISKSDIKVLSCSFSKKGDDLNQWRSYSDDGTGICIGFNKSKLKEVNNISLLYDGSLGIESVRYDLNELTEQYNSLWRQVAQKYGVHKLTSVQKENITAILWRNSATFKNEYYQDEEEIRIFKKISLNKSSVLFDESIDFRVGKYGLTAYSTLDLIGDKTSPINTIILGPKCPSSIEDVYQLLNLNGIRISKSQIIHSSGSYR